MNNEHATFIFQYYLCQIKEITIDPIYVNIFFTEESSPWHRNTGWYYSRGIVSCIVQTKYYMDRFKIT